jgi:hypothetical protein
VINFSIDNNLTRFLGVDTHVCELQLCMRDFAIQVIQQDLHHLTYLTSNYLNITFFIVNYT